MGCQKGVPQAAPTTGGELGGREPWGPVGSPGTGTVSVQGWGQAAAAKPQAQVPRKGPFATVWGTQDAKGGMNRAAACTPAP